MIQHPRRTQKSIRTNILRLGLIAAALALVFRPPLRPAEFLTLEKALEIAFRNSPSIQEAYFRLQTSGENLKAQQAGLKSQFSLTLNPSWSRTPGPSAT